MIRPFCLPNASRSLDKFKQNCPLEGTVEVTYQYSENISVSQLSLKQLLRLYAKNVQSQFYNKLYSQASGVANDVLFVLVHPYIFIANLKRAILLYSIKETEFYPRYIMVLSFICKGIYHANKSFEIFNKSCVRFAFVNEINDTYYFLDLRFARKNNGVFHWCIYFRRKFAAKNIYN